VKRAAQQLAQSSTQASNKKTLLWSGAALTGAGVGDSHRNVVVLNAFANHSATTDRLADGPGALVLLESTGR
jgi:hypothetical protein